MAYWLYKILFRLVRMFFFLVLYFLFVIADADADVDNEISQNMSIVNTTIPAGFAPHTIYFGKDGLYISGRPLNNRKISQSPFMTLFSLPIVQFVAYLLVLWAILEYPVFGLGLITCGLFYVCSYV